MPEVTGGKEPETAEMTEVAEKQNELKTVNKSQPAENLQSARLRMWLTWSVRPQVRYCTSSGLFIDRCRVPVNKVRAVPASLLA